MSNLTIEQFAKDSGTKLSIAKQAALKLGLDTSQLTSEDLQRIQAEITSPSKCLPSFSKKEIVKSEPQTPSTTDNSEAKVVQKLLKAKQLDGANLGSLLADTYSDALLAALEEGEARALSGIVRQSVTNIRKFQAVKGHVAELNGTTELEEVLSIEAAIEEVDQERKALPSEDWKQFILPPAKQEKDWKDLLI